MIEVVCNDRLGKKVRVKCKYVAIDVQACAAAPVQVESACAAVRWPKHSAGPQSGGTGPRRTTEIASVASTAVSALLRSSAVVRAEWNSTQKGLRLRISSSNSRVRLAQKTERSTSEVAVFGHRDLHMTSRWPTYGAS